MEILQPKLDLNQDDDDDDFLGAWAGNIGVSNKIKLEQNKSKDDKSNIISFYDKFDREKQSSIFD